MSRWDGLEEIVAIADAGSFVGAARLLGMSTSHVSRAIADLEQRLGASMFVRTTRIVSLTDTGRALVEQTRRIIVERDEALAMVNGSAEPQGDLRLTCSVALGERFVAPIVRRFAEAHPKLNVRIDLTNRIVDIVGEGYDLGIRTGPVSDPRLASRQIAMRPIELCASPDYLNRAGRPRTIDDLASHDCLVGTSSIWHFRQDGRRREFVPRGRWQCNSGAAVLDAALAGMGICQLPLFYVRWQIEQGQLEPVLAEWRGAEEPISAVYPRRQHLLPKVRNLVDALARDLEMAIEQGAAPDRAGATD